MDIDGPVVRVIRATSVLPDDTPDVKPDAVMLDIPDQLFGNSFTIISDISAIFSDLMMVSDY